MNIRKELLQELYDLVINNDLCPELLDETEKVYGLVEKYIPLDTQKQEEITRQMRLIEYTAFLAGANTVLDFIAGREVQ